MARSQQPLSPAEKERRLRKAFDRERWETFESAVAKARDGVFQFHDRPNCIAVTHLVRRTDGSGACSIVAAAGTMDGIRDMVGVIERFATDAGCAIITWSGRPGWSRVFERMSTGYRPKAVVYEKELAYAQHPQGNHLDTDF